MSVKMLVKANNLTLIILY